MALAVLFLLMGMLAAEFAVLGLEVAGLVGAGLLTLAAGILAARRRSLIDAS